MKFEIGIALHVLGRIASDQLPALAADALVEGYDSPSLRRLAGETQPGLWAASSLLDQGLQEIGGRLPSPDEAKMTIARQYARYIADGTLSPIEGAQRLWEELGTEGSMTRILSVFEELIWAWEDDSPVRPFSWLTREDIASRIQKEAERLLALEHSWLLPVVCKCSTGE